ncbi:hypothetical protein DNHGIG_37890 [Collibacillus ludicampi]|jgi:uncharacterized protein (TIGR02058 family)|uniref:Lin0512 family protein n=1 Tax=Collibacillus ludicampi TaxID=2771369 RepID=A0AAV4LKF8_9BACL|nr:Lin0512 family protein [Collibacillus ludicampi]GIM48240.1 hypothetical protein DNHGIG_37890 [Collibacillus ludicampi]
MEKVMFIEIGMGVDLHGQDITVAAIRAVKDAIGHNSMPGLRSVLPNQSLDEMQVRVTLGVPIDAEKLDIAKVKEAFPYGQVEVKVVQGGLICSSGVVLPEKGDVNDLVYIVNAAVEVGY